MADISSGERQRAAGQGDAMPGGRFPIRNRGDLEKAIKAVGRAKGGEAGQAAVRRFILKRAKELNLMELIPNNWAPDGSVKA